MNLQNLVGKTITAVFESDYGDIKVVVFDDDTGIKFGFDMLEEVITVNTMTEYQLIDEGWLPTPF